MKRYAYTGVYFEISGIRAWSNNQEFEKEKETWDH